MLGALFCPNTSRTCQGKQASSWKIPHQSLWKELINSTGRILSPKLAHCLNELIIPQDYQTFLFCSNNVYTWVWVGCMYLRILCTTIMYHCIIWFSSVYIVATASCLLPAHNTRTAQSVIQTHALLLPTILLMMQYTPPLPLHLHAYLGPGSPVRVPHCQETKLSDKNMTKSLCLLLPLKPAMGPNIYLALIIPFTPSHPFKETVFIGYYCFSPSSVARVYGAEELFDV